MKFAILRPETSRSVVYSLNILAETLALSIMINSVFMRQLLNSALPSVMSKLVFLADTNLLSATATLTTWMLAAIVWVVALGGLRMSEERACSTRVKGSAEQGSLQLSAGPSLNHTQDPANRRLPCGPDIWHLGHCNGPDRPHPRGAPHLSVLPRRCSQVSHKRLLTPSTSIEQHVHATVRLVVQALSRSERRLALGRGCFRLPRGRRSRSR